MGENTPLLPFGDAEPAFSSATEETTCPFCRERPATLLCDRVIGFEWKGDVRPVTGRRVVARDGELFTCDRAFCGPCGKRVGVTFLDGPRYHEIVTHDHCPQCQADPGEHEPGLVNVVTRKEADAERRRLWRRSEGRLKSLFRVERLD